MTNEMLRHRYAVNNAGSDMWGFKFSEIKKWEHFVQLSSFTSIRIFAHDLDAQKWSSKMGFVIGHKKKLLWERDYERPVANTKQKFTKYPFPQMGSKAKEIIPRSFKTLT